jgi:hypothetical protein
VGVRLGLALALCLFAAGVFFTGVDYGKTRERGRWQAEAFKASEAARATEAAERARSDLAESQYLGRIRELESFVSGPVQPQPVRLCDSPGGSLPRPANTAGSPDAATGGGQPAVRDGESAVSPEPDISRGLVSLAARCERDRQTLMALQGWLTR